MAELQARPMGVDDLDVRIRYFHEATDEHLQLLGVDRSKLITLEAWRKSFVAQLARPVQERTDHGLMWEADGRTIGFSTAERIVFGDGAYMHLHLLLASDRRRGYGSALVRRSARTYVELFELERLYCELHAFNAAPNRTLQAAGFSYVSTQRTIPAPLNFEHGAGYRVDRGRFGVSDGDDVPALLLQPETPTGVGIVVFHQHNREWHLGKSEVAGLAGDPLQAIGPALAAAGITVLAPYAVGFEDRALTEAALMVARGSEPGDALDDAVEVVHALIDGLRPA